MKSFCFVLAVLFACMAFSSVSEAGPFRACSNGSCSVNRSERAVASMVAKAHQNAQNRRSEGRGVARLRPRNWFGACR